MHSCSVLLNELSYDDKNKKLNNFSILSALPKIIEMVGFLIAGHIYPVFAVMEKGRQSAESAYQQRNLLSIQSSMCTVYGGPQANKMAEVALNLTKGAVSP